jgi:hypothetical protein
MSSHANKTPKNPGFIPGSHRVKVKAVPRGEAIKNPRWTSESKAEVKGPSAKRGGSKKKTKKLRKTMRKRKGTKSKKTKRHHKRR